MTITKFLLLHPEAGPIWRKWAKDNNYQTFAECWDNSTNLQWMLKMLEFLQYGEKEQRKLRLFSCWCALKTPNTEEKLEIGEYLGTAESKNAIEVSKLFAHGKTTVDKLAEAREAAKRKIINPNKEYINSQQHVVNAAVEAASHNISTESVLKAATCARNSAVRFSEDVFNLNLKREAYSSVSDEVCVRVRENALEAQVAQLKKMISGDELDELYRNL